MTRSLNCTHAFFTTRAPRMQAGQDRLRRVAAATLVLCGAVLALPSCARAEGDVPPPLTDAEQASEDGRILRLAEITTGRQRFVEVQLDHNHVTSSTAMLLEDGTFRVAVGADVELEVTSRQTRQAGSDAVTEEVLHAQAHIKGNENGRVTSTETLGEDMIGLSLEHLEEGSAFGKQAIGESQVAYYTWLEAFPFLTVWLPTEDCVVGDVWERSFDEAALLPFHVNEQFTLDSCREFVQLTRLFESEGDQYAVFSLWLQSVLHVEFEGQARTKLNSHLTGTVTYNVTQGYAAEGQFHTSDGGMGSKQVRFNNGAYGQIATIMSRQTLSWFSAEVDLASD